MKKTLSITAITFFLFAGIILFTLARCSKSSTGITIVKDLRVEYMKNPVGIDVTQPRFSWKMESKERGAAQSAYTIVVSTDKAFKKTVWNSGEGL